MQREQFHLSQSPPRLLPRRSSWPQFLGVLPERVSAWHIWLCTNDKNPTLNAPRLMTFLLLPAVHSGVFLAAACNVGFWILSEWEKSRKPLVNCIRWTSEAYGPQWKSMWGSVSNVCLDRGRGSYRVDAAQFSRLVRKVFRKRQALQFLFMIFVTFKSHLWHDWASEHARTHTHKYHLYCYLIFF